MANTAVQSADNLSMESIAFQDKKFGKALEALIGEILEAKLSGKDLDEKYSPRISAVIKEFTNLTTVIRFNATLIETHTMGPHVQVGPVFLNNHVFLDKSYKGVSTIDEKEVRERLNKIKEHKLKNTINTRRAWVTGIFAETPIEIVMPSPYIYSHKLTKEEIVGILIHEIGHAFTICEYGNRFNTTNQVLATMLRANSVDTMDVRSYVFKEAGEILTNNEKMFSDITENITSDQAVFTIMLDNVTRDVYSSESGTDCYDYVSCEQAADQFASRMGYGRHLVTGLDKLFTDPKEKSNTARHFMQFADCIMPIIKMGIAMVAAAATGGASVAVAGLFALISIGMSIVTSGELKRDHTYDISRVRYLRLREDLLQRIKDKKIPKELVSEHLDDLKVIDKAIDSFLKTEHRSYFDIAANFIFKKNKQALDARMLQRQLEELASNDLYRVAAQLRTN